MMRRFSRIDRLTLLIGCMALPLAVPAAAGVVRLTDGTSVEGEVHKSDEGWVVTGPGGKRTVIPAGKVASVEVRKPAGDEAAARELASLRRAMASRTDIKQVLDRYN